MKRPPAQDSFADQLAAYLSSSNPTPAGTASKPSSHTHWMAFTSVAGSVLALASSADAAVYHVVPTPGSEPMVQAGGGGLVEALDVNLDGIGPNDIRLRGFGSSFRNMTTIGGGTFTTTYGSTTPGPASSYTLSSGAFRRLELQALNGAKLEAEGSGLLKRLSDSDAIPATGTHVPGTLMAADESTFSGTFASGRGQFLPPGSQTTGLAAFSLPGGEFGWIRLRVTRGAGSLLETLTLLEWAWADVGESIRAGQTEADGPQAVPEPATWIAGLAMGAAGIQAYRNRRKAEAAPTP